MKEHAGDHAEPAQGPDHEHGGNRELEQQGQCNGHVGQHRRVADRHTDPVTKLVAKDHGAAHGAVNKAAVEFGERNRGVGNQQHPPQRRHEGRKPTLVFGEHGNEYAQVNEQQQNLVVANDWQLGRHDEHVGDSDDRCSDRRRSKQHGDRRKEERKLQEPNPGQVDERKVISCEMEDDRERPQGQKPRIWRPFDDRFFGLEIVVGRTTHTLSIGAWFDMLTNPGDNCASRTMTRFEEIAINYA